MIWGLNILIFMVSAWLLYVAGEIIVKGLLRISRFFGLKEFVVAFFVMAVAASLPNLFVGITSAIKGVPELSFGDIMGNNLIAMTIAVGLSVFFAPKKEIPSEGKTIQTTLLFTLAAAVLPIVLTIDHELNRIDGLVLISLFVIYIVWLFSKKERFAKIYEEHKEEQILKETGFLLRDTSKILIGVILLTVSAQGIVRSASFVAGSLGLPIILIGLLIVGFGSALPEIYFAVSSAKKGETWMILGNLMGAVIIPATLVLGIVALVEPIKTGSDFSIISRVFLIISAIFFFIFTKTSEKIKIKEGLFLILLYLSFLLTIYFINI